MNSLMTSRSSGSDGGHSVCSSLLSVAALAGAVCGGGGEDESIVCSLGFRDHNDFSSMQIISSAFIDVDGDGHCWRQFCF